jgi:hypothetical protein
MKHSTPQQDQSLQDRFGRAVAARLSESTETLPYDISERLRAARMQALSTRKAAQIATAPHLLVNGGAATLGFGEGEGRLWHRLAALVPLLLLIAGLIAVNMLNDDFRAKELADIDAAILTDDLPPAAYTDAGFVQFLKSRLDQAQ